MFVRKLPFFIQTPWVGAIGNMSEEIYYGLLRARRENRKVIFFFPYDVFKPFIFSKYGLGINSELKKVESKYRLFSYNHPISIIGNIALTIGASILILVDITIGRIYRLPSWFRIPSIGSKAIWMHKSSKKFLPNRVLSWDWGNDFSNYLEITLPDKSNRKGSLIMKKMGIPDNAWYVCVYARDSGYYSSKGYKEGRIKEIRNSDIDAYKKSIKLIIDKGGYVVRLGDSRMKEFTGMKGRGFIDYPFTEFKSDLMDLYLIKNCKFFLGPISGIYDVAAMFQIASLMPNSIPNTLSYPRRKEDIFIYKHVYDKISNNFVSVVGLNDFFKSRSFSDKSIEFFENTEEEIYELVKEFFSRESGNIKYSDFQLKWISEIKNTIIRDEINEIELKVSVAQKYRHLSKLLGANGVIGKRFIQENYSTSSLGKRK